jgi:hypothetical protein
LEKRNGQGVCVADREIETWELEKLPDGFKALPMKWVYKIKRVHANGNIERYKARLVAKRYLQKQGVDFVETAKEGVKARTVLDFVRHVYGSVLCCQ